MGIRFGKNAGTRPAGYAKKLAQKIARSGGNSSTGAGHLLAYMAGDLGGDQRHLCPEEAEQAARSLEDVSKRLRGTDREIAKRIAQDAREAADSGRTWTVG